MNSASGISSIPLAGSFSLVAVVLVLRWGALEPSATSEVRIRLDPVLRLGLEQRAGAPEPPPKTHTTKQTRTKREKDQCKDHKKWVKQVDIVRDKCHKRDLRQR